MSKIVGIIHARMTSSRLPGKVLMPLKGKSMFYHHVERMRQCHRLDKIYLATSTNEQNNPLIEEAQKYGVPYYAGSENDVLSRLIAIAEQEHADAVIRCGCDKPLFSFEIAEHLAEIFEGQDYLYPVNIKGRGVGVELFTLRALKKIHEGYQGEFITNYIFEFPHLFRIKGVEIADELSWKGFRLAVDTPEDFELVKVIYDRFYQDGHPVKLAQVLKFLDDNPEIANINRFVNESKGNSYIGEVKQRPVFALYQNPAGKYLIRNRMGQVVSHQEFRDIINQMEWEK